MPAKKIIDIQEARRLYEVEEYGILEVAAMLGCNKGTLKKNLVSAGVVLRGHKKTNRAKAHTWQNRKTLDLPETELHLYRDQDMSTREIAQLLGCHQESVRMAMIRFGIERLPAKARSEKNYFWRGGRIVDREGYVLVKANDHPLATRSGYVREHRLIMERILGRYLTQTEVVHHKDKNKQNNSPDNLELFDHNGAHLAHELQGQCPKWTEDGKRRIREGNLRKLARHKAILEGSVNHVSDEPESQSRLQTES